MSGADTPLGGYGLPGIFAIMLLKEIGVPIPVPSDLIMITAGVQAAAEPEISWFPDRAHNRHEGESPCSVADPRGAGRGRDEPPSAVPALPGEPETR